MSNPRPNRMKKALKVVIIGGGIGGIAAALALRNRGVESVVYERSGALREVGAGLRLTPNAMKALRHLGVEQHAMQWGVRIDRSDTLSWRSGRVLSTLDTRVSRHGAIVMCIHRADMLDVLHQPLPDSAIHLNANCVSVTPLARGAVARFEDGSEVEADVVVGADGIHSSVRASLFGEERPRFTGCVCWRGLIPREQIHYPAHTSQRWLGPRGHVAIYPVRRGELINFVAHYESDAWTGESWTQEADPAELERTYARWHASMRAVIQSGGKIYKWALFDRDPLSRWGEGHLTLLGDAAHPMLPYLAQGAGMSLEDACVLAQTLDAQPDDPRQALREYERLRMPRTRRVQLGSRARAAENHLASPWSRLRRDVVTALRTRFFADRTHDGVGWIYDYDAGSPREEMATT